MADALVPFSQCDLWDRERTFFHREGPRAWVNQVPFHATSNPYIAHVYATLAIRFVQDCLRNGIGRSDEPFYLVEVGAGSGTLAFHLVRRLGELQAALGLAPVSIVYVMTDLAEANLAFWQRHPALQPYFAQGVLDCAGFDALAEDTLTLRRSGVVLRPEGSANPLIGVANYLFDSLPQDAFRLGGGRLQAGLTPPQVPVVGPEPYVPTFTYRAIDLPWYAGEPDCDAVLRHYAERPEERTLLLPIGGLRAIRRLTELGGGRLLLFATDKAHLQHPDLYREAAPELTFHGGGFSLMVDFAAIAEYVRQQGGDCLHQPLFQGVTTSLFAAGLRLADLPETRQAAADWLVSAGPGRLETLCLHLARTAAQATPETFLAALELCRWDPQLWYAFASLLPEWWRRAPVALQRDLYSAAERVAANAYFIPGNPDILAVIAGFFQVIGDFWQALEYYHRSRAGAGDAEATLFNQAVCHCQLQQTEAAVALFRAVLAANPANAAAREWLAHLAPD